MVSPDTLVETVAQRIKNQMGDLEDMSSNLPTAIFISQSNVTYVIST